MDAKDVMAATATEIDGWPGVEHEWQSGAKHMRLLMTYAGRRITVITSATPSDNARGLQNHIAEVRRSLRQIGAIRTERAKSNLDRERNKPNRPFLQHAEPAPIMPNPFDDLEQITWKEEPMAREVTINGKVAKLEKGLAVPDVHQLAGRAKGDLRLLLESMEVGESVFLPESSVNANRLSATMTNTARALGDRKFIHRTAPGGHRVWCVDGQPASRPRVSAANQRVSTNSVTGSASSWS